MKISQTRRTDQVTRTFDVTDGPVLPFPYSSSGKTFRVKTVAITYTSNGGSPWATDGTRIQLQGAVLKKNGDEGKETYNGWPEDGALRDLERYRWLRSLIGAARPVGRANMLAVNDLKLEG